MRDLNSAEADMSGKVSSVVIVVAFIAQVAMIANAAPGRMSLYEEYKSGELLEVRARISKLGEGPEFIFTRGQAEQVRSALLCHPKVCTRQTQVLLEAAREKLRGLGLPTNDFDKMIDWQVRFCKAIESEKLFESIEDLVDKNKSYAATSNEECNKICQDFREKNPEIESNEQFVKANEEIINKINTIDANKAEEILTDATKISSQVATDLLKKLNPNSYSYELGDIERLIKVSETSENVCQLDQLAYILGKAVEFKKTNKALRLHMQNLASNQYKACNKENPLQVQDPFSGRVATETIGLIREFVRNLADENHSKLLNRDEQDIFTRFHNVVELIKKKADASSPYESYGKPLGEACDSLLRSFDNNELKLYEEFIDQPAKSKQVREFLETLEICKLVPSGFDYPRKINRSTSINLGPSFGYAKDLSRLYSEQSSKSKPIERTVKIFERLGDHLYKKGSSKESRNLKVDLVNQLEQLCNNPARESLLWMVRVNYPSVHKQYDNVHEEVNTICEALKSAGYVELREKIGGKKSMKSKFKNALKNNN